MAKSKSKAPEKKEEKPKQNPTTSEIDDIFATKGKPTNDTDNNKRKADEIDDIFAGKNAKNVANEKKLPKIEDSKKASNSTDTKAKEIVFVDPDKKSTKQSKKDLRVNDDDGFSDSRGKQGRKTTEEGYPVFDSSELNIGTGGDTEDCPFDCTCCY
ncbi:hypothetical protein K7432_006692 [Basidiobolus ranarum]|uniref:DUF1764-domain-containing protein n=1 Tax=Basidiobolus ranarum TaxID=34480 RepID=A0ABR2WUH4_9FUNG